MQLGVRRVDAQVICQFLQDFSHFFSEDKFAQKFGDFDEDIFQADPVFCFTEPILSLYLAMFGKEGC